MDTLLEALLCASAPDRDSYRPMIFRMAAPEDRARLEDLLKSRPPIVVLDELVSQLTELVRAMQPAKRFAPGELAKEALAHLNGRPAHEYGVWVFYPWSNKLVHLLDEDEFVRVRTDRNRNKITTEEQALLATKKLGVIGLSVGQSVCLTLALERSFGELRIADFDTLDLSNLNRIRSGVHELGHSKVVNTAREIAELDPFLKVTVFSEGINEENIHAFLTEGGNLDLLIEECDSVAVKIIARQHAKALRIPVVMDTSDRGMIDVERFDLEPERPILHGLIDHLDPRDAAKARTNEEKLPFVVPIIGLDTMSVRMKASMLEIESTVGTWPQLASSVVLGGALVSDIHRRIAIGTFTSSGRWFLDAEELVKDQEPRSSQPDPLPAYPRMTLASMLDLAERIPVKKDRKPLASATVKELVEAGVLAPSAGNLQPWQVLEHAGRLLVFHNAADGDSGLDPGRLIPAVDMGTFLENVHLCALGSGCAVTIEPYPLAKEHRLVALIEHSSDEAEPDPLSLSLRARCTNRRKGDARPLEPKALEAMEHAAAGIFGCRAHFLTNRPALDSMAEVIAEAERLRILHPVGHAELFRKEIRWSPAETSGSRDGLDLETMELKLTEKVGFHVAADAQAMDLLASWRIGRGFMKMTRENMASASALALVSCTSNSATDLLNGGRSMQRLWLAATAHNLAVHPCAAPILLSHPVRHGFSGLFEPHDSSLLLELYDRLAEAFGLDGREAVFMARLSYASSPSAISLRRPLSTFLHSHASLS